MLDYDLREAISNCFIYSLSGGKRKGKDFNDGVRLVISNTIADKVSASRLLRKLRRRVVRFGLSISVP